MINVIVEYNRKKLAVTIIMLVIALVGCYISSSLLGKSNKAN